VLPEYDRSQDEVENRIDNDIGISAGHQPSELSMRGAEDTERVVYQILSQLSHRDRRLLKAILLEDCNRG
jgi:hypothetical protein